MEQQDQKAERCRGTGEVSERGRPTCPHGEMIPNGTRADGTRKWTCPATRTASWKRAGRAEPHTTGKQRCRRTGIDSSGRPTCEHGVMLPNGRDRWMCREKRIAIDIKAGRRKYVGLGVQAGSTAA